MSSKATFFVLCSDAVLMICIKTKAYMISIKMSDKNARFPKAAEPLVVWERVKREPNRKGSLLLLLVPFVNTKGTARRGMSDKSKQDER
jgi:hypothetical protein